MLHILDLYTHAFPTKTSWKNGESSKEESLLSSVGSGNGTGEGYVLEFSSYSKCMYEIYEEFFYIVK